MAPFVDVCKLRLREDIQACPSVSELLRDDRRLKPQPFALLSFTRVGGTILFLTWARAVLLLPAQTWP